MRWLLACCGLGWGDSCASDLGSGTPALRGSLLASALNVEHGACFVERSLTLMLGLGVALLLYLWAATFITQQPAMDPPLGRAAGRFPCLACWAMSCWQLPKRYRG